jgi:hypothetical protein
MMFVIDNQTKFCSGLDVHGLNTRNRKQLYLLLATAGIGNIWNRPI